MRATVGSRLPRAAQLRVRHRARQRSVHAEVIEHLPGLAHFRRAPHAMLVDALAHVGRDVLELQPRKRRVERGEDLPLHVYPYAVSRHHLEQVIQTLQLPVVLTKEIDQADAVLALRSHLKNHSKLRHLVQHHQVPIHAIKSNTLPQIVRGLKRLLNREEIGLPEDPEGLFSQRSSNHEELEALEEARLAVEQLVLPKGQPVELLPRPSHIRKMQHELVEHYHLKSASFGEEPNRRLRIYPA